MAVWYTNVIFAGLPVLLKSARNRVGEGGGEGDAALPPHTHTHHSLHMQVVPNKFCKDDFELVS